MIPEKVQKKATAATAAISKQQVVVEVDARGAELIELSLRIHAHPELGFHEVKAAQWITSYLEEKGFRIERGICQLPTAFRASYGSGKPVIGFLAEYDALPKLGHACGHNIIAACAVGAAVAARGIIEENGGEITVIGTPAEEMKGGKAIMVEREAFAHLNVAMMVHPGTRDTAISRSLACASLEVEYFGRAAHASAHPDDGINALEAMIQAINGINSLRQHIRDKARIHGIITDGGEASNVVPAHAAGSFLVRAEDEAYLEELKQRVINCFMAAALTTGAQLEYHWSPVQYATLRTNLALARTFAANMAALGRIVHPPNLDRGSGSTDMGNVSWVVPSIHPSVAIAPRNVLGHSNEFAAAAASTTGHRGLLDGAKALAMTAVDIITQPALLSEIKEEFQKGRRKLTTKNQGG
ncbi:MAG: M20 family metallopeptidase [Chloroflexi bacterium]|nr:M20 family metallopeptidase [Chloroflexota bacterium]